MAGRPEIEYGGPAELAVVALGRVVMRRMAGEDFDARRALVQEMDRDVERADAGIDLKIDAIRLVQAMAEVC